MRGKYFLRKLIHHGFGTKNLEKGIVSDPVPRAQAGEEGGIYRQWYQLRK